VCLLLLLKGAWEKEGWKEMVRREGGREGGRGGGREGGREGEVEGEREGG